MNLNKKLIALSVILFQVSVVLAQPGGGGDPGGGQPVPITGLEILLAAGGILGIRRFWKSDSKK